MSEFITIGEPLVIFASKNKDKSLVDSNDFHKVMGGAELNVAVGVSRLGHTAQYISQVGSDPFGKYIKKTILSHNIGVDYLYEDPNHFTGYQLKQLVSHGDPSTFNYRKNSAACYLNKDVVNKIDLSNVKIAHMSGIFPAISDIAEETFKNLFSNLIRNNIVTTFDPNLRPPLWSSQDKMISTINELANYAQIVLPGIEEGKILVGTKDPERIADFYLKSKHTKVVIVKIGAKGAFVKKDNGDKYTVNGFHVKNVVDTVGAGDGFALGVITALLEGQSLKRAVIRGNAIGALQVQTPGDNDGYPTQEQLKNFYKKEGIL
ncbi:sugar kinase [Bombilactobacillus bombi]|uniref:sugar kinase n=1 Tax=Bombilactobacillus bombi TaxID=1303590 RepID=UPI000E57DAFB|nr:sugar kinase [Bombilactobacillus bombi]AXX65090.1 sugar kinase [Bombilactobacillus bombi]